jgi:hypothetical protein
MNVIDKILNEWSFRCHDGIVDMNDPTKVSILNEILANYNLKEQEEQNIDDKIKAIISNLKDEEKEQIYKSLIKAKNKINKVKDEDDIKIDKLIDFLIKEKQIPENLADYIVLKAKDKEQINELENNLLDSISLNELRNKENKDLKKEAGDLIWINNVIGIASKSLAIGKGELLLAIMIKEAKLIGGEGVDLEVSGREVEIKQNDAIVSEKGRSSGYQKMWSSDSGKLFKNKWFSGIKIKEKNDLDTWTPSTWTPFFNRFKDVENKLEYTQELNALLKENDFTGDDLSTQDFTTLEKFCKKIAYLSVGNYLNGKDLILMNSDLQYVILNNKEQILEDNNIYTNASYIPRISYKKPLPLKENENLTEELTDYLIELFDPKGHFKQRVNERGNVLDILNLNEIPLKDYNTAEVKEKLKSNISNEIKERAVKILEKESIASSLTYEVGIKVLKPVLIVDGKEYSLKLFAKSTKVTKDGDVIEKDNIGTLYFATVYDNKVSTLLLLNKEDDNELYLQIKKHAERIPGKENKEAKILTPPNYIYRIDLDELMGKEKSGPKLTDPTSLDYIPKAAYKPKSKFTSKSRGEGTIVAASVSGQRAGEPDGNGIVDWIDVEFKLDKPKLKSGKLINSDIVRFNTVLTTSYKDFVK